ncbi:MAG: GNAT family N-acetyltransferase [Actinomycetota bacterium]
MGVSDWQEWRSLRLAALADAPDAFGSGLADWADADDDRWRARLRDVPLNVIADLDGEPVGQVSGLAVDVSGAVELISMWVAPNARGLGVGDALIDAVVSRAVGVGARRVELDVKETNRVAQRLYERHQFARVGAGSGADELRMVKLLAAP